MAVDVEGVAEGIEGKLGGALGIAAVLDAVENESELVAADTGEGIRLAVAPLQALGDFAEESVAGIVAKTIVDDLEPVEIDVQESEQRVVTLSFGDALERRSERRRRFGRPVSSSIRAISFRRCSAF